MPLGVDLFLTQFGSFDYTGLRFGVALQLVARLIHGLFFKASPRR